MVATNDYYRRKYYIRHQIAKCGTGKYPVTPAMESQEGSGGGGENRPILIYILKY